MKINIKNLINPVHLYEYRKVYVKVLKRLPNDIDRYTYMRIINTPKLKALKDKYRGRRCFIVGNGPSLKNHDLRFLIDEYTFVTNWFVLHEVFKELQKCFYCLSNSIFWGSSEGFYQELVEALHSNPDTTKFFRDGAYTSYKAVRPRLKNVFFINLETKNKVWEGHFSTDIWKSTSWGRTVIIEICLPIAFHLGFSTIYLLGCDCDFKFDVDNSFGVSYFYDLSKIPPKYREWLSKQREDVTLNPPFWEASYSTVKLFFEKNGRKIYNAGKGGKLEVFERVDYDSLFSVKILNRR